MPKPSGREAEPVKDEKPAVAPVPPHAKTPAVRADFRPDLGRGGAQHQAIQQRLKKAAEECGFRATIERPILEGQGSVDLLLERSGQTIACEISITTTIDHEVGNVGKCLKAGFSVVAVVSIEAQRLQKIAAAVRGSLGAEAAERVECWLPENFIEHLHTLPVPVVPPPEPETKSRRGYKVKRSVEALSPEERKRREEVAIQSIAEEMRKKKRPPQP